ncbi:MAG: biopolymer transporter ExbD [Bacteroidia bacterium]|nr:biopolymer transporter ExbD [Bacteroidia bacterium]
MARFEKKKAPSPAISTASLPDIVFMLLFFFMVSTVLRQTDLLVDVSIPRASQLEKLENKSLVSYIYIGDPRDTESYGSEDRIQVNDVFIKPTDIPRFIAEEKVKLDETERDKIIISMKVDREAKMGIVNDVKLQLREADARKVNYASVRSAPTQ